MKYFIAVLLLVLFSNCGSGQQNAQKSQNTNLSALEFAEKIQQMPVAPIIDVRTPAEFEKGHVAKAKNINWNGDNFDQEIATFDKSKPILVYCLSGGRSGAAAAKMRANGFKEVYEMGGGMMKWRAANLPETTTTTPSVAGMTTQDFEKIISSDKTVLVDFYADWCAPCKKMKPYLDEIAKDLADKVLVVRINADENPTLCKALKIEGLPVLQVYKNKTITWNNTGFVEKEAVLKKL